MMDYITTHPLVSEGSMTDEAPRVFLSHASEDKERFVIPFAARLRAIGIDAWVDQWEMGPGDSLVQRIFDEGIAFADAFVVVLSHVSVVKPWVREELDAGVVQRIVSGRSTKLMPVILDADVAVPAALRHLLWESVPLHGLDGVTERIADQLLGRTRKPPLGPRPIYSEAPLRFTEEPADEMVFMLIVDKIRSLDGPHAWELGSQDIRARAQELGIDADRFSESMHALVDKGLINARVTLGEVRWIIHQLPDCVWLRLEEARGVDLNAVRKALLASIVNERRTKLEPTAFGIGWFTFYALMREFDAQRLLKFNTTTNGNYVSGLSPLARRVLREYG